MAKFIRRMLCVAAMILLIVALGTVCFAVGDQETVCYEHGDVDGDGKVTNTDAIYIMYNYMFGDERFPINQEWDFDGDSNTDNKDAIYIMYHFMFDDLEDYKLNGTIHSYYAPTWTWDETAHTAEVTFKCGCGKTDTYTTGNGVTVAPGAVEEATCVQAGLETYVASVVVDGKTYTNTYEKVLPAGVGHQMDGTPDCENGSDCLLCDYSLPKLGHNMTPVENVAATCTQDAYTTYECSNSGCDHIDTVVQEDTAGHSLRYDKDVQNGCKFTKWYACDKCDYTAAGETDSDVYYNHTYTATLTQDATCVSEGVKTYACQCGVSYTEEIPINDSHAWVAGETVDGVTTHTCERENCGATKTTVSAANTELNHEDLSNELQLENGASMSLDQETLNGLDSSKQVVVSIAPLEENDPLLSKLSDEKKAQIGDNTVYNFDMRYSDGTSISDNDTTQFAGEVTISLPYELADGEDIDSIDVWYIDDNGEATRVTGTYSNGYVTFTTTHFSYYTVTRLTPAERCARYGHIMVETFKAATCTEDGFDVAVCQRCGHTERNDVLKKSGHDYKETVITEAGCDTEGTFQKVCQTCQHVINGKIPVTGHNMQKDESQTVAPGCNNVGKEVYVCANGCGHTREYVKSQLTHQYVQHEVKAADCTTTGYVKNICTRCDNIVTVSEEAPIGHAYTLSGWQWSEDNASAVVTLVCTHNGEHTKELKAVITVNKANATCTGAGSATYTATASLNKITYEDVRVEALTATGHKAGSQWHSNAGQHYHVCTACGVELDAQDHTFDSGTVIEEATCASVGAMEYKCVVCERVKNEPIPATGEHIYVDGVCSGCGKSEAGCDHSSLTTTEVDLSTYGMCGGILEISRCSCGEISGAVVRYDMCQWEEVFDPIRGPVSVCASCGTVRQSSYSEEPIEGETCFYNVWRHYAFFDKDGNALFSYEWKGTMGSHPFIYELELKEGAADCDGGYTVYGHCELCGATDSWENFGHGNYVIAREILSEGQLCGTVVLETRACACGKIHEEYLSWVDGNCQWDNIYTEGLGWHDGCSICGGYRLSAAREEKIPGTTCDYLRFWRYTYYDHNDTELFHYETVYEYEQHTSIYQLQLKEGAADCNGGYTVYESCELCDYTDSWENFGHCNYVIAREILSEGQLCGTLIQETSDCACGEGYTKSLQWIGGECRWEYVYSEELGEYQICSTCGAYRTYTVRSEKIQGTTCDYRQIYLYNCFDRNGNALFSYETESYYSRHRYIYELELKNGAADCDGGYTVYESCDLCDFINSWENSGHQTYTVKREILSEGQLCGTLAWQTETCACGDRHEKSLQWIDGECNWEWVYSEELDWHDACSICGAYITQATSSKKVPDTTCDYLRTQLNTYFDRDGNVLFSYETVEELSNHEYIHELRLNANATDCEGGVTVYGTCRRCGFTDSWEHSGHGTFLLNREILSEGQLCGTLAWDTDGCACGENYSKSLQWINGECIWEYVYSEELGEYQVCSTCGAYITCTVRDEKVPGTTCDYRWVYLYTYFNADGDMLFSYETVSDYSQHEYIHQLQLMEGAADCDGGYTVTGQCILCGHTESWENFGHETYLVNKEILSEGQLCGTLVRSTSRCACGQVHQTEIHWENGQCEYSRIWDDGKQQWVDHCSACGTTYDYETHKERVEGTTCQYHEQTVYTYYDVDGSVLFGYTVTSLENYHNYEFTFKMNGDTCADGYYPVGTCQDCDETIEYGLYTDCSQFVVERRVIADGDDICGTVTLERMKCPCGDSDSWEIFTSCDWEWTDNYAVCKTCGLERTDSVNTVRKPKSCEETTITHYEFVLGGQSYEAEYSRVRNNHNSVYTFQLLGETCADGYYVTEHCTYCDYSDTYDQVEYCDDHSREYFVEAYDLSDYGLCGGYLYFYSCPCNQRGDVTYNFDCNRQPTGSTDPLTGMQEYYCEDCGTYSYDENSVEHDKANCIDDGAFRFKLVRDGETLLERSYAYQRKHHDYELIGNDLITEGTDCTEGVMQTYQCAVCGATKTESIYHHAVVLDEMVDLTEHGACCGYVENYSCACGAKKDTNFQLGDNHQWEEDIWESTDDTGMVHTYTYSECITCGMTILSDRTDVKVPDVLCEMEAHAFNTVTVGDYTGFYEETWWWYQHNFGEATYELQNKALGCDGGVLEIKTCTDCNETSTTTHWYHLGIKQDSIDLSEYGAVCGSTLDLYACLCGAQKGYEFGGEPGCDVNQENWEETKHWIEGVIDEHQESTHGETTYSYSYLIKCAVTDPDACGLTIRMSRYWLKEGCTVTEYETWQLGYDEATGTWSAELTIATGRTHSYHDYVHTDVDETLEDGYANGYKYTCSDCGSYYSYVTTYDADENLVKTEETWVNTLKNGERQKKCYVYNYEMVSGENCLVMHSAEYTEADGSLNWNRHNYEYDLANCERICTYTDSVGMTDVTKEAYHHSGTYQSSTIDATCTQHGEERWWYVCNACGESYDESYYEIQPGHDWSWNEELQMDVCGVCGLQNKNGASGSIVMEDLTDTYGNGENYVIGYWNQDEIDYDIMVSVILESTGEQILLNITEFTDHTVENDGFNGLSFNKATADAAAAEAVSTVEGYEGTYAIRISFVPVDGTDTLDYAITFDSATAQ